MPTWAHLDIPEIDFQDIIYYAAPKQNVSGDEVDEQLVDTFNRLGISLDDEKQMGSVAVDAVMDSVSVKTTYSETLMKEGIIFCSFSEAVQNHPELVKQYMASVVPYGDNYFAALNSVFLVMVKGVMIALTYFRLLNLLLIVVLGIGINCYLKIFALFDKKGLLTSMKKNNS